MSPRISYVQPSTVNDEAMLAEFWRAYGGSLTRIAVETMEPPRPFMTLTASRTSAATEK